MLRPGSDNASYHSASEAAAEVAKSLLTGLQLMLEAQVKPRLEVAKEGRAKSSGLPFRKLGYSDDYLLAGLNPRSRFMSSPRSTATCPTTSRNSDNSSRPASRPSRGSYLPI